MTLEKAFEDTEFIKALDQLNFQEAFSFLDHPQERAKLFLALQEEGLNPLTNFTKIPFNFLSSCRNIKYIEIPNSVTSIGDYAFSGCSSLESIEIPNSVTSIGDYAFHYCIELKAVHIGKGVTAIGSRAFMDCYRLTDVFISDVEAWLNISFGSDREAFPNDHGKLHILNDKGNEITNLTLPDGITSIGDNMFRNCDALMSIIIPDSVTSIGNEAFFSCDSLTNVAFGANSNLQTIGNSAFLCCNHLMNISLPNSIVNIKESAFETFSNLTTLQYRGTIQQFKKTGLHTKKKWRKNSAIQKIICVDGEIDLT